MPRYALLLEYHGAGFFGWQRQASGVSVQQVLEAAAARLVGGAPVASITAGRTDSGVHASGQVASIDLERTISGDKLRDALNYHMKPHAVAVLRAVLALVARDRAAAGPTAPSDGLMLMAVRYPEDPFSPR